MPSTQNNLSHEANPGETRLDSALDYLLAKSKTNETGNYRRNADRVLNEFLDWAEKQDIETFDALNVADLEDYALSLSIAEQPATTASPQRPRASTTTPPGVGGISWPKPPTSAWILLSKPSGRSSV